MARRRNISSETPWEAKVGYSRAVAVGPWVFVAGTTAGDGRGGGEDDAYAQTRFILERIGRALGEAGAPLRDVVRTAMYVTDISRWEEVGRAHGEVFGSIRPAATMVEVARLLDPRMLVEIEATAYVGDRTLTSGPPPSPSPG